MAGIEDDPLSVPEQALEEEKKTIGKSLKQAYAMLTTDSPDCSIGQIMACEDFSSLQRLLRVTAHVLRFIDILKYRTKKKDNAPTPELTASDLRRVELFWLKEVQHTFAQEKMFDTWKRHSSTKMDSSDAMAGLAMQIFLS